jgi:hypothetical protein
MANTTTKPTATATEVAPTISWATIHIFGYGETQIIGDDKMNKKFNTTDLTKVEDVVDYVYSLKPEGNQAPKEYHIINIFKDMQVSFIPKDSSFESWSVEYADVDTTTIDALATELIDKPVIESTNI